MYKTGASGQGAPSPSQQRKPGLLNLRALRLLHSHHLLPGRPIPAPLTEWQPRATLTSQHDQPAPEPSWMQRRTSDPFLLKGGLALHGDREIWLKWRHSSGEAPHHCQKYCISLPRRLEVCQLFTVVCPVMHYYWFSLTFSSAKLFSLHILLILLTGQSHQVLPGLLC